MDKPLHLATALLGWYVGAQLSGNWCVPGAAHRIQTQSLPRDFCLIMKKTQHMGEGGWVGRGVEKI